MEKIIEVKINTKTKILGVILPELMNKVEEIAPSAENKKVLLEDLALQSDEEREWWLKDYKESLEELK